jgi:hypothetical protein
MHFATALRAVLVGLGVGCAALAWAQVAPLQSQETNNAGVVAELTECKRSEGVLSIKVRLRNTANDGASVTLIDNEEQYDNLYIVAEGKKYFVLRDTDKKPLAVAPNNGRQVFAYLPKGGAFQWWAKYPAPPGTVKKVTYVTTFSTPFEGVAISDQ